jgi:cysteine desulfurase
MLSTSAHKINGPKFSRFSYIKRNGVNFPSFVKGGRAGKISAALGLKNVPAIAGFLRRRFQELTTEEKKHTDRLNIGTSSSMFVDQLTGQRG